MGGHVGSYLGRIQLTQDFGVPLVNLLLAHGFIVGDYGSETILSGNSKIASWLKKINLKESDVVKMVKFTPDCICIPPKSAGLPFLFEIKTSKTPVILQKQIDKIERISGMSGLTRCDIGEIEADAWDVYNKYFPKDEVAIAFAAPYTPEVIVVEWVSKIIELYRKPGDSVDVNPEAEGSGTLHVNIHLGKMRSMERFYSEEFGIHLEKKKYQSLKELIKAWKIFRPSFTYFSDRNKAAYAHAVSEIRKECPWLITD